MAAENLPGFRIGQDLDEPVVILDRTSVGGGIVRSGGRHVGDAALLRLLLGEPNASDLRGAEHGGGHAVVIHGGQGVGVEHVVGHVCGLEVGVVLELVVARDVTQGPNSGHGGAQVLVRLNEAAVIGRHPGGSTAS